MVLPSFELPENSKFIVFDGIDGCGKTTLARALVDKLEESGKEVTHTFEPGESRVGMPIREMIKGIKYHQVTYFFLFNADRSDHLLNTVIPDLKKGKVVVCERYDYATWAYQQGELSSEDILSVGRLFPRPTLSFIIDTPVEVALSRIMRREEVDRAFEQHGILEQVRNRYQQIWRLNDIFPEVVMLDGTKSIEELNINVMTAYMEHIIGK